MVKTTRGLVGIKQEKNKVKRREAGSGQIENSTFQKTTFLSTSCTEANLWNVEVALNCYRHGLEDIELLFSRNLSSHLIERPKDRNNILSFLFLYFENVLHEEARSKILIWNHLRTCTKSLFTSKFRSRNYRCISYLTSSLLSCTQF